MHNQKTKTDKVTDAVGTVIGAILSVPMCIAVIGGMFGAIIGIFTLNIPLFLMGLSVAMGVTIIIGLIALGLSALIEGIIKLVVSIFTPLQ